MNPLRPALLFLLACVLAACGTTPAPTPTPIPSQLHAGHNTRLDLPPDVRPTEGVPQMTLHGVLVDETTKERLVGTVYLDERQMFVDVDEFTLVLPRRHEGWLRIAVPGYQEWKIRLRYQINHSKMMEVPVRLMPDREALPIT